MTISKQNDFRIDAVITWVDGDDKAHKKKMEPYIDGKKNWKDKNFQTRFNQVEEIKYNVNLIIKYAPFIKNIFIVTDGQTPSFLNEYNKTKKPDSPNIKIIDHKVIYSGYEHLLPVFCARAIETMIYRIPDLSENFVYFNDDMFLIKDISPSDFFENGQPIIRGKWSSFDENITYKIFHQKIMKLFGQKLKDKKYGYKRGQQRTAKILGLNKYYRIDHTPTPIRKSTLKNYFDKHSEVLLYNISHKFRHPEQYVLQSMANHLEIKNHTPVLKKGFQLGYLGSYKKPLIWYKFTLFRYKTNSNKLFLNLQSLDLCHKSKLNFILGWLHKRLSIENA